MRQDRKKFKDDDTGSVISEARSQRSMVIDGSSVRQIAYIWDYFSSQYFSDQFLAQADIAENEEARPKNIQELQLVLTLAIDHRQVFNRASKFLKIDDPRLWEATLPFVIKWAMSYLSGNVKQLLHG